ncbi:MAG: TatD family hydrolase [Patescibacteria group bacterium]
MIDTHCHLQFQAFEQDYDAVIKRAREAGVTTIINAGTQVSSSKNGVVFAEKYPELYAVVAVHPHHADKIEPHWITELEKLTKHPKVVGIGECGLDYFSYASNGIVDPKKQKEVFEAQIVLAHKAKLPLQIHNRHAGKDVLEMLRHHKNLLQLTPGMFHCFAGDMDVLKGALDLGFAIGIDGNSTYKGLAPGETVELRDIIKATPLDRIVIETDSPYLTPIPHRGERNEPAYAIITAQFIADVKQTSLEKLIEQTDKNVYTIFTKLKIF